MGMIRMAGNGDDGWQWNGERRGMEVPLEGRNLLN